MVNEIQVREFVGATGEWERSLSAKLVGGNPGAASSCLSLQGTLALSQSSGKQGRKLNPTAGGPGSRWSKANPTPKTFQLSQQRLIFA